MCLERPVLTSRDSVFAYKVVHRSKDGDYLPVFMVAGDDKFWDTIFNRYPQSYHALMSLGECVELLEEILNKQGWWCKYTDNLVIVAVELSGTIYKEKKIRYSFNGKIGYKAHKIYSAPVVHDKLSQVAGTQQKILFEISYRHKAILL